MAADTIVPTGIQATDQEGSRTRRDIYITELNGKRAINITGWTECHSREDVRIVYVEESHHIVEIREGKGPNILMKTKDSLYLFDPMTGLHEYINLIRRLGMTTEEFDSMVKYLKPDVDELVEQVRTINGRTLLYDVDITSAVNGSSNSAIAASAKKRIGISDRDWVTLMGKIGAKQTDEHREALEEGAALLREHPYHMSFKMKINDEGDIRVGGVDLDKLADIVAPGYAYAERLIWKKDGHLLSLANREDFSREIGIGLKEVDARRYVKNESVKTLWLYLLSSCDKVDIKGKRIGKVPVKNGIVDVRTGEFISNSNEYFTSGLNVEYDADATCPNIDAFFNETFNEGEREMLLSLFGAVLTGKDVQFVLALIGRGRNGKSMLEHIIKELFGTMLTTANVENLDSKFSNSAFIGKRIAWQEEFPSTRKGQENLKRISGGATIQVEAKGIQGVYPETLQALVVLDTNAPPAFESGTAMNERLRVVQMPYEFVDDPKEPNQKKKDIALGEKVAKEMSGFLNKLLPYAQHYYYSGRLLHDEKVDRERLDAQSSSLETFIDECCDVDVPEIRKDLYGNERSLMFLKHKCDKRRFLKYYHAYCQELGKSAEPSRHTWYTLRKDFGFEIRGKMMLGIDVSQECMDHFNCPRFTAETKDTRDLERGDEEDMNVGPN